MQTQATMADARAAVDRLANSAEGPGFPPGTLLILGVAAR